VKLRLLAGAEAEIESARCYFNGQAHDLGTRFLDDLELTLQDVLKHPASFPKLETLPNEEPYQRALLRTFRYAVVFELLAEEILVVAVTHTSREPNYWLRRRE
jgi:plasmid stabilization system protein ParE